MVTKIRYVNFSNYPDLIYLNDSSRLEGKTHHDALSSIARLETAIRDSKSRSLSISNDPSIRAV